jgi:YD repeat-containing protein
LFNYNDRQLSSSGIKEFFYQGFEEDVTAATVTPYAGNKYYSGDYQVLFTKPNTRTYKVNYHYLEAGVWKNVTKDYSDNMVLTEGDAIDEVRVYPSNAYITTYTYKPLIGISSETDPNGKTIYYEYDPFNRLKLIRDQDGKIVKTSDYKYQQPQ